MILDLSNSNFLTCPNLKVLNIETPTNDKRFYIYNLTSLSEPFTINNYEPDVITITCQLNEVELMLERLKFYSLAFEGDLIISYCTERHGNQMVMHVSAVVSNAWDRKLTDIAKVLHTSFKLIDVDIQ